MQKFIQPIATSMIVLLLVMLIWIFLSYYKGYENIEANKVVSGNEINVSNPNHPTENSQQSNYENLVSSMILNSSGDNEVDENNLNEESGDTFSQGNNNIKENESNTIPNVAIELPEDNPKTNEIISSNTETSSQEKQEVLNEIDEALKGLLEAVRKVEVVDETRLDATLKQEVETQ